MGNPAIVVHLESGEQALIVEGRAAAVGRPDQGLAQAVAEAYRRKYSGLGYAPESSQWDEGGLYRIAPRTILAWTKFNADPTKFVIKPAHG